MYYKKLKDLLYSGKVSDLKESLNLYIKILKQKNVGELDYELITVEELDEIYGDLNQSVMSFINNEPNNSMDILDEKLTLLSLFKEIMQLK